jgi:Xaa-Pro aminopeptidase
MTDVDRGARIGRLRGLLAAEGVQAILISQPENRYYFSGFSGSSGWLIIGAEALQIATDFRYFEQVASESPAFELVRVTSTLAEALPRALADKGHVRIGFEADHATYGEVQAWQTATPEVTWLPLRGLGVGLRAIKDASELSIIRRAARITDEAVAAALRHLAEADGPMTERELAWFLEEALHAAGAHGAAFEIIVAGGPNGSRPHARSSDRLLRRGEPIVIDIGARVDGYSADLTRTVCVGAPEDPSRYREIYDLVARAEMAAISALRPGMTGAEADAIARSLIAASGYGDYFGHGLGHGVGLAVHEEPRLSRTNPNPLAAGAVVTVEPGIYLPGWGGVRIEDLVLLTEKGATVLSAAPKTAVVAL